MNTLSVTVRYRPIRIGWCVRAGDFTALRETLKYAFTMWGGRFNPVIPVDDFSFASQLVRLFRVDVLWPVSEDEEVKKFIKAFPHLPNPFHQEELFVPHGNGKHSPQIIDIYHPILRFYEEHFKNNPKPDVSVTIFEWQAQDPLADVLLATRGDLPNPEVTGTDYLDIMGQYLSAKSTVLSPEAPLPLHSNSDWMVSTFSRAYILQHYSVQNHLGWPGIYIGSANEFEDLINFWNLLATNTPLMFFDPKHEDRLNPVLTEWLQILQSRPKGRFESDNKVAVWFKDGSSQPDVSRFGQGLLHCTLSEDSWNGLNIKAPYMYFSEGTTLASVDENSTGLPRVSFQLPPKPFKEDKRSLLGENIVASIDHGIGLFGNERATIHTLFVPELNEYYGRQYYFEYDKARVEPNGIGIISHATRTNLSLSAIDVTDLIRQVFSIAGIDAQPSKPGLIATQLIQQMGGIQGCRPFKITGVRELIEKYRPDQPFTRSGAIQIIRAKDDNTGKVAFDLYEDIYIESRPIGTKLTPDAVLAYLLKKGVFRAGLRFDCPSCRLEFWTSLDDIRTETTCEYCGHNFNITPYLKDRDWAFRRSGLFGREDHQEGAIPVILTLQQLHTIFNSHEMLYTTAMNLKPKSTHKIKFKKDKCETDLVVIIPRSIDGKINVAIGECKTREDITDDDVYNLKVVADSFPSERFNVFVIFSKLAPFSQEEIKRMRQLNNEYHRRVILFTERELEPYHIYERTIKEFKIDRHAVSFEDMVNVTEQVFLNNTLESKSQK